MLTVELAQLRKKAGPAAQYLRSKLEGRITAKGSQLHVEEAKARDVKLLLNKFLHREGMEEYRVIVTRPSRLEIRAYAKKEVSAFTAEKGSIPTAPDVLPYQFPGNPIRTPVIRKGKRRER
ncbi:MAG TPA: hypothetical protein VIH83_01050 [Candidatus Bathyarchaeia archaeon]|nr:hypothetical protein [Candidatus Bathyarchaeia archaeon]